MLTAHWNNKYETTTRPNWIETGEPSILAHVKTLISDKSAHILVGGVGDSNIVSYLLDAGYTNITVVDISQVALDRLAQKVDNDNVQYIQDNLIAPERLMALYAQVDVYIDRAVLHFFTKEEDRNFYFEQLEKLIRKDGHAMIGVFDESNRAKCCGLDLHLYSEETLSDYMNGFDPVSSFQEAFVEINGNVRNYLYWIGKKK